MIQVELVHTDGLRETRTSGDQDVELTIVVGQLLEFMQKRGLREIAVRSRD